LDRSSRCLDCAASARCPFFLDLHRAALLKTLYLDHEHHDGYQRDGCVFSDEIDIEDAMSAVVEYRSGVSMSYSLHAFAAQEGYSVAFNGSLGRLEHHCDEESYVSGDASVPGLLSREAAGIRVLPLDGEPRDVPIREAEGGHGGGDQPLLADLLDPAAPPDPLLRAADQRAGAWSILTGVAANRSIETGQAVDVDGLVTDLSLPDYPSSA
jgi:hypothetical protein